MTYVDLVAGPKTLFTGNMSTQQMLPRISVLHFKDQWGGVPEELKNELTAIIAKMRASGKFVEPTADKSGTTLMDVMHLLGKQSYSVVHVVLAANYYGIGDLRP